MQQDLLWNPSSCIVCCSGETCIGWKHYSYESFQKKARRKHGYEQKGNKTEQKTIKSLDIHKTGSLDYF